jgi:uncharacterized protein (DUF2147 family)
MRSAVLAFCLLFVGARAFAAGGVEGEWITSETGSKVRIGACPNQAQEICGVVSWLPPANAKDLDKKNPDAALRNRPILGVTTVSGFRQAAPGKWTGGKLYDPGSGKTYKGKISLNPDGTLKVEGCVLMVCQAQTWKRG